MSLAVANYGRALAAMTKLAGLEPDKILNAEAGIILKTCVSRTKVASATTVRDSARLRTLRGIKATRGEVTINAGVRGAFGKVWVKSETSGKYVLARGNDFAELSDRHLTDEQYSRAAEKIEQAKSQLPKAIKAARLTAALARQSWIRIADLLGIVLENVKGGGNVSSGAITKARAAKAKGNVQTQNGGATRQTTPARHIVTLINRLPYGGRLGFQAMLNTVVAGRAAFFATAVAKGYRGSLEQTAKLFPGWTVK